MQSLTYRPVLIYGAGIHLSGAENEALEFAERYRIPIAPTWAALDCVPSSHELFIGSFGTHGTRAGNLAVQNATHIISVGSRLDSKATGTPIESFARQAHITMVDIDQREINKFGQRVKGIHCDARQFFKMSIPSIMDCDTKPWLDQIKDWKQRYPVVQPEYYNEPGVNPYVFIDELSKITPEDTIICTDTGCSVAWVSQAWRWKNGQRFIHAFNQTPMGYGLPGAIGACYATGKNVLLITGDGSLMMSIGELATVAGHKLPIKIFMFNNEGHGMCRQTQREWMGSTYPSTSLEGGLTFPKFREWARGNSNPIHTRVIENMDQSYRLSAKDVLEDVLAMPGPTFTEVLIHKDHDVVPKVKYGHANEDGHPLIDVSKEMLIPLWTVN